MKLSVLQWNIWFKEQADNVLNEVKRLDPDIICLQELTSNSTVNPDRDIPSELVALGYHSSYVQSLHNADTDMGNAIFSKFAIINTRHIYVQREDPTVGDYSRENRIYIEATVTLGDSALTIGTVHLSYTHEFLSTAHKDRETDNLLATIRPNTARFILTGDLNALPDSYTIKQLGKALVPAGPDYNHATWTTKPFSYNGFEAKTLDWRLDYVFTTPDIHVLNSQIIDTPFSDHLPILIEVEV